MADHRRSYAAFDRADVADAKRGCPEWSLQPWAHARGLEYLGSKLPGALSPVLPVWEQYVFNLCRGVVAPGRLGVVLHELEEVGADGEGSPSMGGTFWSVRHYGKSAGLLAFTTGIELRGPVNEPFAADSFWIPATKVAVRVPESVLLPRIVIRTSERMSLWGDPKLDDGGLPGFKMHGSDAIDDAQRLAIAQAARPLGSLGATYAGLHVEKGAVAVFRNGFVADPAALDTMGRAAVAIAEGLAALAWQRAAPAPFDTALPPPDGRTWWAGWTGPAAHESEAFGQVAREFGMTHEDPLAYHRIQPRCPVPGRALGVLRGLIPGTVTMGRVGFFDQGRHTSGTYRTALFAAAREGVSTPVGGHLDPTSDMYVEVVDGVAYAWPRTRSAGALQAAPTVARGVEVLHRLGLVEFAPRT